MNEGYIKLDRKLLEWRYFSKDNYLKVWLFLLLKANHKNGSFEDITVKRGQLITSIDKISKGTGTSTQQVRTILKKLEGQEITSKSTNKYTLITILKYRDYQDNIIKTNKHSNKQLTNKQQTTNKQLTTNNNNKNDKNIEEDIYKWREAGFENEVKEALKISSDSKTFNKIMNILTDDQIQNKKGYIYTLQMKGEL